MKIYVSEKEDCFRLIKKLKPIESGYIAVITPLDGTDASIFIKEVESLEQHEAEIRKQAKQEVIEEVLRLVNTLGVIRKSKSFVNGYDFAQEQLKQKLKEMKGE